MALTGKEKKYIKKNLKKKTINKIASELAIRPEEIEKYLEKLWGKKKLERFLNKTVSPEKKSFSLWIKKNRLALIGLAFLVFIAYANSLNNEFLSDDIGAILENKDLDSSQYFLSQPFSFIRALLYFGVNKLFGRVPFYFRLINVFFHLGSVLILYGLISLLIDSLTGFLAASILAVHPIIIESVAWISGGPHTQYSFFLLLALLLYLFSQKKKKFYFLSLFSFLLGLFSAEKAIIFPIILFLFIFAFEDIKKKWPKTIPFFGISLTYGLSFISKIFQRAVNLQEVHYQTPEINNPFYQIPIALVSYLKLVFWPKDLTLYHSEMVFTDIQFLIMFIIFLGFLGLIAYAFKKNKSVFFWLCFFIIALSPTLLPFGLAWIVAERYAYLGVIGIFASLAILIKKLNQKKEIKNIPLVLFFLTLLALTARTIRRNIDWKNQDNLWLAAAKTSPSSAQNHNNLGDLYGRRNELNKAIEEFQKAIELKPNYASAYHNLANIYWRKGEREKAVTTYQKGIEIDPNLWQSHQNLAAIFFELKRFDLSEEHLKKAIEINPQETSLYLNLSVVYSQTERKEKAKELIQKVLEIEPENQKAKELFLKLGL